MTGYGEAERPVASGRLRARVRTVNHRFLNTSYRTPSGFDRVEASFEGWIRPFVSRGHVTVTVTLEEEEETASGESPPEVDLPRARRWAELLRVLKKELDLSGEVTVSEVARFPDVFRRPEPSGEEGGIDAGEVRAVIESALEAVVTMREAEGARLEEDMRGRVEALADLVRRAEARAPERLERERERLREAVRELTEKGEVDEERLSREIVYLAEKWDIHEELVRFRSHLEAFTEALDADGPEPVGKRLTFLVQEMHREANTIGAKANDAEITAASVGMKEEIERLREQAENVE